MFFCSVVYNRQKQAGVAKDLQKREFAINVNRSTWTMMARGCEKQ